MQITVSYRTQIEIELIRIFGLVTLKPICTKMLRQHLHNAYPNNFGANNLATALYATGTKDNPHLKSDLSEFGLFFKTPNLSFAVGVFQRPLDGKFAIFFIAPIGKGISPKLQRYAAKIAQALPDVVVYTRYVNNQAIQGFERVTATNNPWVATSPQEDETTPQVICDLTNLLDENGFFIAGSVEKYKQNNQKLRVVKTQGTYELRPLTDAELAMQIITDRFASLKNPVGSTADDYYSLIKAAIQLQSTKGVFAYMGYWNDGSGCQPVSVWAAQEYAPNEIGVYANITSRPVNDLPILAHASFFQEVAKHGIIKVNLGGCELAEELSPDGGLAKYKRARFGNAAPIKSEWHKFSLQY